MMAQGGADSFAIQKGRGGNNQEIWGMMSARLQFRATTEKNPAVDAEQTLRTSVLPSTDR